VGSLPFPAVWEGRSCPYLGMLISGLDDLLHTPSFSLWSHVSYLRHLRCTQTGWSLGIPEVSPAQRETGHTIDCLLSQKLLPLLHRASNDPPGLIKRTCPLSCPSASPQQGFPGLSGITYDATVSIRSRLTCTSFEAGTVLCHHVSSMTSIGLG
jgi:hypothetical protein